VDTILSTQSMECQTASTGRLQLSVVVPTFNERVSLPALVQKLRVLLVGVSWEVIVVDDDSPDGTAGVAAELAAVEPRVRCLRRIGRRGLASACIEGMLASTAPYLAVMDADLQHDETLLPQMLGILRATEADVVIGSRYLHGTEVPGWNARRHDMSRLATQLARLVPLRTPSTACQGSASRALRHSRRFDDTFARP
jgi:dolichol-phosphate mannosyltransferase